MTEDKTNVATGQTQRRTPQTTEGHLDAQASAEGDLRRVPRAAGHIEGVPLSRIWVASGRLPFDDEDTTILIEASTDHEAYDRFEACLYENEEEGVMEINEREHGGAVYMNELFCLANAIIYHKDPS
jgi:hypothetical protein